MSDLSVNAGEPLCEQRAAKKTRLIRIRFNRDEPVIIVSVLSLKLSPNLRKVSYTSQVNMQVSDDSVTVSGTDGAIKQEKSRSELQIERLELILQAARM